MQIIDENRYVELSKVITKITGFTYKGGQLTEVVYEKDGFNVKAVTTTAAGLAAAEGISHLKRKGKGLILPLQEWHAMIRDKD